MPPAKNGSAASAIDPASLGASIPVDDDQHPMTNGTETAVSSVGEAPALFRHEPQPPPPPQSPGQLQRGRRLAEAAAPRPTAAVNQKKEIARLLPSQHRVYVYKRKEDGKLAFLNEYGAQDVMGAGTIEVYIKKYVVPEYGYGEFHLHLYDGNGDPRPMGLVTIEAPAGASTGPSNFHALPSPAAAPKASEQMREMLALQKDMAAAAAAAMPAVQSPQETYLSFMKTMRETEEMFGSKGKGGMDPMMMFFMMDRMKPAAAPQVDPALQRLLEKVIEKVDRLEDDMRMSASMVPPPPVSSESAGPSMMQILIDSMNRQTTLMIEAVRAQQPPPRDPIKELADMATLLAPKNEGFSTKDVFELMPKFRDMMMPAGAAKDPFEKTIENFRLFKMMQREFGEERPSAPPNPDDAASFWSFAKGLVQSDIGKSIASQILSQGAGQEIVRHQQGRTTQQQQQAAEVARRRAAQAQHDKKVADARAAQLSSGAPAQPAPQPAPAAVAPPKPPAPPAPPPAAQEEEEEGQELDVPEGFLTVHADAINNAANDAERIGAIITGFQLLATSQDFRGVITKMFGLCKLNHRLEALDHLREILEFFSENDVLNKEVPDKAVADFDKHWALIRMRLEFPDVPEVWPEGHPNAVPAQAQQETAPEQVAS